MQYPRFEFRGKTCLLRSECQRQFQITKELCMAKKRIGILTGGGDVPGLNSVIKLVVYRSAELGCEVTGIRRGWEG